VMVRSAVRPLALPLILAVLFAGPIGASEGVLIARRSFPFLATAYLATTALLPPALLMVKRRGGPVMLIWACFAAFQAFRASIFTWRVWGQIGKTTRRREHFQKFDVIGRPDRRARGARLQLPTSPTNVRAASHAL
jgi:hypothetical protein